MSSDELDRLGRAVRIRRTALQLSLREVQARGGPSQPTVTDLERGRAAGVSPSTLRKLDAALEWEPGTAARRMAEASDDMPLSLREVSDADLLAEVGRRMRRSEEVGDDARSAANRQAAERAANIEALRGPDPSGLDLAAETEERRAEE